MLLTDPAESDSSERIAHPTRCSKSTLGPHLSVDFNLHSGSFW